MRYCTVCGRPIRTGIKYCYVCRSIQKAGGRRKDNHAAWVTALSGVVLGIMFISSNDKFGRVLGVLALMIGIPLLLALIGIALTKRAKEKEEELRN